MSRALLKDESRGEDNSPGVNNTVTRPDIVPEHAKKKKVLTKQMILHHVAMFT